MGIVRIGIALLACMMASGLGFAVADARQQTLDGNEPVRGVNVYYQGFDAASTDAIDALLADLRAMGVTTVLLTFPIYIDALDGSEVIREPEGSSAHPYADTPTNAELTTFVERARKQGFAVWLRPLLDERALMTSNSWRGELAPADPAAFFTNYTALLEELATGVGDIDWLVIGTEFNSLQHARYDPYWTGLIETLRKVAPALQLTYASNWDSGPYPAAPAWFGLLDGLSVDAWFPALGMTDESTSQEIAASLGAWTESLRAIITATPGVPLFVTELGVASQAMEPSVVQRPWQWPRPDLPSAPEVQARFAAGACEFYTSLTTPAGQPLVDGIFWWVTSVGRPTDPLTDRSFDFVGKPAERAITECFTRWSNG